MTKPTRRHSPNRLLTDALREIKHTKSRFLSLLVLSALAVCFLAGLRVTAPDMKLTADRYFDRQQLMDLRVVSTLALTREDVDALDRADGVLAAQGAYTVDALLTSTGHEYTVKVHSLTDRVNLPRLVEGRMPQAPDELLVEPAFLRLAGVKVGDTVRLDTGSGDFAHALHSRDFTVVGAAHSPLYINMERGSSTLGTGRAQAFVLVPEEAFALEYYTEAYLRLEGADGVPTYSDDYEAILDRRLEPLEPLAQERARLREEQVIGQANDKLDEARQQLETARADVTRRLAEGKAELDDARIRLDDGWKQYRDGLLELDRRVADAQQQITDGQQELANAKADLEQGALDLADARKELDQGWETYRKNEQLYLDGVREYEDGVKQYQEGLAEYEAGKAQYEAGWNQCRDGAAAISRGWAQYEAGVARLEDSRRQLDEGRAQLEQGETAFGLTADGVYTLAAPALPEDIHNSGEMVAALVTENGSGPVTDALNQVQQEKVALLRQQIDQTETYLNDLEQNRESTISALILRRDALVPRLEELAQRLAEIDEALEGAQTPEEQEALEAERRVLTEEQANLTAEKAALDTAIEQLQDPSPEEQEQIELIRAKLAELRRQLDEAEGNAAAAELVKGRRQLDQARQQLEDGEAQYAAGAAQLENARGQLNSGEAQLDSAWHELEVASIQLRNAKKKLDDAQAELIEAKAELNDGKAQLDEGKAQLEEGEAKYLRGQADLADGWKKYEQGLVDLDQAQATLDEEQARGRRELAGAKAELLSGERTYEDGLAAYEQGEQEAQEELLDAQDQIDKAQRDIETIQECKWYLLDRNTNMGYVSYSMDADRMGRLASVFPMIFFLVAALVCLTTMTRMVEEQRIAIGGLKALGYSRGAIAIKYVGYGFLASAIGSLIGLALGLSLVPWIICTAWKAMYTTGELYFSLEPITSILACLAAVGTVTLAALGACFSTLTAVPAQLMRPKAPPIGKRILLERITPLWSRLSFNHKITLRNLFRYKRRFWMTVVGIGGCAALIVTAFGLRGSLFDVVEKQYNELCHYTAQISLVDKVTDGELRRVDKALDESGLARAWQPCRSEMVTAATDAYTMDGFLQVLPDDQAISRFITLRHRSDGQSVTLPDHGAVLTEKLAHLLDLSPGDSFAVTVGDRRVELTLADVTENYVQHFIYISDAYYREVFGREPVRNLVLVDYDTQAEHAQDLAARIVALDGVTSLSLVDDTRLTFANSLNSVDYAVVLIIFCAAALAFVVLYNLTNINITERMRELATLKVLGFYDPELSAYVYRENVILTFFGVLLGMGMGKLLHRWLILTVEVDMLMFGRELDLTSYLWAAVLTVIFSLAVNLAAHWKLKKLDMVESLKTVE